MSKEEVLRQLTAIFGEETANAMMTLEGENTPLDPDATNKNNDGSIDLGLFQINSNTFVDFMRRKPELLGANGIVSYEDMRDVTKNIAMARIIFNEQGWNAWYGSPKNIRTGRPTNEPMWTNKKLQIQPSPTPTPTPVVAMMNEPPTIYQQPQLTLKKKSGIQQLGSDIKQVSDSIGSSISKAYRENLGQFSSFIADPFVTGQYGAKNAKYWGNYAHEGTDFRAAVGTPVMMPEGWTVVAVNDSPTGTYGRNIQLKNSKTGELIQFAHLNKINLKVGQTTMNGTSVGFSGNTGSNAQVASYDPHLHVNYWDATGKRSDVTKAMKEFSDVVYSASKQPSIIDKIVKPVMASEKETSKNFSSTVVPTPNQIMPRNQVQPPVTSTLGGARLIKAGETLSGLAKEYNTNYQNILKLNPQIKDPNKIYAGDALNVPVARVVVPTAKKTPQLSNPMATPKIMPIPVKQPKTITGTSFKIW